MTVQLIHGNCLDVIPTLPDCSVDAIVTDPPYELGFMGKKWDASGIAYNVTLWQECLRVLKPGGHLLAFGGTRTYHRMACAIEDAGFEIRDSIHWLYGSGFPKSLDVSKAIDKQAGAEREVIGMSRGVTVASSDNQYGGINRGAVGIKQTGVDIPVTAPATEQAKQWAGWGTALKPAHEPVVVARKPLVGTVAQNVLEWGTGAINIDASRIGNGNDRVLGGKSGSTAIWGSDLEKTERPEGGRWPANVILTHTEDCQQIGVRNESFAMNTYDGRGPFGESQVGNQYKSERTSVSVPVWECAAGCAVAELDRQSGVSKSVRSSGRNGNNVQGATGIMAPRLIDEKRGHDDSGGASRFFYCAKPSRRERNTGLNHLPEQQGGVKNDSGRGFSEFDPHREVRYQNHHPTVKPLALMRYLVRLVTPPGGTVLEPFAGSGTTLMAATLEGFNAIGIEMTDEYLPIIKGRVAWAEQEASTQQEQLQL